MLVARYIGLIDVPYWATQTLAAGFSLESVSANFMSLYYDVTVVDYSFFSIQIFHGDTYRRASTIH